MEEQTLSLSPPRTCSSCYACCVYLGIEELKKRPTVACKHLNGANGPDHRCGIYSSRPQACSQFQCLWLQGIGPDHARPDKSGLLVTMYSEYNTTIIVTDQTKAGTLTVGFLSQFVDALIKIGSKINIVDDYSGSSMIYFADGKVYHGRLIPRRGVEELSFEVSSPPFAHYQTFDSPEAAQAFVNQQKQEGNESKIITSKS